MKYDEWFLFYDQDEGKLIQSNRIRIDGAKWKRLSNIPQSDEVQSEFILGAQIMYGLGVEEPPPLDVLIRAYNRYIKYLKDGQ